MARALFLAGRARGRTTPNPLVGAVVVSPEGVVVGAGYHERAGEPHAEVHALRAAGDRARGATLYCTLEPCCHTGRTPPCVDRIIAAGIARVVAAIEDPNPLVAGRGFRILREQGVAVEVGIGRAESRRLNDPFFSVMRRGRPFVIAKIATSLDGMVALRRGERTAISSEAANRRTQRLRAEVDAVGIGSGTLLVDDPVLTAREVFRERPLARVIFDRRLRASPAARVFGTLADGPVYVMAGAAAVAGAPARVRALEAAGARVITLDSADLARAVAALAAFDIQSLLIEGGPGIHEAAFRAGVVDRVRLVIAPRAVGAVGVPWVPVSRIAAIDFAEARVEPCGADVIIEGYVHRTH